MKKQFLRVNLRYEGTAPDPTVLGTVLERSGAGRFQQLLIRDPRSEAIDALRISPNVYDVEETPMSLEEIYTALLSRPGKSIRPSELASSERVAVPEED